MQEVPELNTVRLHLEMDNPVGVITIFHDLIQETLDECIPNLQFALLLPLPSDGTASQQEEALIARDVLIRACKVRCLVFCWCLVQRVNVAKYCVSGAQGSCKLYCC